MLGLYLSWLASHAIRDVLAGRVATVEGAVHVVRRSGRGATYEWHVGGLKLTVPPRATEMALEGRHVRVHYLPRSKRVVSAQTLAA